MKSFIPLLILIAFSSCKSVISQTSNDQLVCIGFYNLENLFDTQRDSTILDEEFTPLGSKHWTEEKYKEKLANLSQVISELGPPLSKEGPILLGLAEVENRTVLRDLIAQKKLSKSGYQILHYDSKDARGIDVALLYKPKYFKLLESKSIPVLLEDSINGSKYTRNILLCKGKLLDETIYIAVNHWPSRRGGVKASQKFRIQVAKLNYQLFDSIRKIDPQTAFIIMGDLNDNPSDQSIKYYLNAHKDKEYVDSLSFYNPFYATYKEGNGSLAFNDSWSMFDQIILSKYFIDDKKKGLNYQSNQIFHKDYMIETDGHYKNYPKRSFSGDEWNHGYSDHFPSLVYLVWKK